MGLGIVKGGGKVAPTPKRPGGFCPAGSVLVIPLVNRPKQP